ncbi:MAG TPA: sulfatase-like hydrolase/transferase [Vicinamibacterales bacterium]|jgi:hypothetical protein|nr:sulfatase-like hydrolase/transferase [Vicinamibacterales bacterium]
MKIRLMHLVALAGFAVAQPLYDVLSKSAEFFVAHRADRLDMILLAFWLSAAVPIAAFAVVWAADRVHRTAGAAVMALFVGLFVTVAVLPAASNVKGVTAAEILAISAVHGLIGILLYVRFSAARQFVSLLAIAAVVFPAWFLVKPAMRPIMWPGAAIDAGIDIPGDTPVVFVIFDQLPLTSLLDENGDIDRNAYPGFAALASDAIWYRNATTVADFTAFAVPALLSGNYPQAGGLPVTSTYPRNLFTILGKRYRIHATEPITDLCPDALCPPVRERRSERQRSMLSDISIVFARMILPDALETGLPRVSENWRDFSDADNLQERWVNARDQDRVAPMREFIESIHGSDAQPALYFAHILLPHEPYVYLPDKRRFSSEPGLLGLDPHGRWPADPWYATQSYRQHLAQVGCVDTLVSDLVRRLKGEGLYDRSLIVVTSDHGVAFRPGNPMKGFVRDTVADVVPVPLLIKPPYHQGAETPERNVQSIDILPTIADLLHVNLPFPTRGVAARPETPEPSEKRIYHTGATAHERLPRSLWDTVRDAARRKHAIFGSSSHDSLWLPAEFPYKQLMGRRVDELQVRGASALKLEVVDAWMYADVRNDAPFVPSRVSGIIHGPAADSPSFLAVAVNGIVSAVTKSVGAPSAAAGLWAALVAPSRFQNGLNPLDVFEVATENGETVLRRAYHSGRLPSALNLISGEAKYDWNVRDAGFYPREPIGDAEFRWTTGDSSLTIAKNLVPPQTQLITIRLAAMTRPQTPLTLSLNDCTLFQGTLPGGEWTQTFPIRDCMSSAARDSELVIRIKSSVAPAPPGDNRQLGLPVLAVTLGGAS